jgi:hypothetical protein
VLEGAWNDHGMGIHVEKGDADSDTSYSDEEDHIVVESIDDDMRNVAGTPVVEVQQVVETKKKKEVQVVEVVDTAATNGEKSTQAEERRREEEEYSEESEEEDEEAAIDTSAVIHVVEMTRAVMAPSLELVNGMFELSMANTPSSSVSSSCVSFQSSQRRWKQTKRLKRVADATTPHHSSKEEEDNDGSLESGEHTQMTKEEEQWCAEQKLKDEENVLKQQQQNKQQQQQQESREDVQNNEGNEAEVDKEAARKEAETEAMFHGMESALTEADAQIDAHVEAENIFFAPFMGSPEVSHAMNPLLCETFTQESETKSSGSKKARRASEIRPPNIHNLTIISPDRLKPSLRRDDGKVSGRMSPIKAPKRSPKSPTV